MILLYQAPIAHHLTDIIDPRGNRVAALDYTDDGRLAASCDANDDCNRMTYDLVGQSQTTEDATRVQTSHTYDTYGNITSSTDGLGNTTTYEGGLYPTDITDPLGNTTRYTYNGAGKVLSRTDPHAVGDDPADHTVSYEYGPWPRSKLIAETNKAGATIYRDRDGGGNVLAIRDDAGNVIQSMTRTNWGKLLSKTDRFGTKTYDHTSGVSQPTRVVDGHGVETTYAYDDSNRLLRMVRAGITARFTYDSSGRETHRDYGNGVTVNFGYSVGVPEWTRITGPTFGTITRKVSKTGRLLEWTKANGDTFGREFDGAGRIATETDALGNRTLYQYGGAGRLESTTREADGATTSYTRDAAGKVLTTTNSNGDTSSNQWESGQVLQRTDVRGFTSSFDNTPTSYAVTDALGRTTTQNLSSYGLPTSLSLPGGTQTSSSFDGTTSVDGAGDFPITALDESGRSRALTYAEGQLATATTQGGSNSWNFTYTNAVPADLRFNIESGKVWLSSPASEASPLHLGATDSSIAGAKFDSQDWSQRLSSMTSPEGDVTSWTYNNAGQLASISYPGSGALELDYGSNGLPTQERQPNGIAIDFTFDSAGNELTRASSTGEARSFTYGTNNRVETATNASGTVTRSFDGQGRLARVDGTQGGSVLYTHDTLGRVSSVSVQVGASVQTTNYTFDEAGNVATIVDPQGGTTTFAHDSVGRMTTRTLPNGIGSTWTYDMRDRVLAVEHRHVSGTVLASRGYVRAPSGEPSRVTNEEGSYVELAYDDSVRVTRESYFSVADILLEQIDYTYDLDGKRSSRTKAGVSEDYQYSPGARLDSIDISGAPIDTFAHDANGRTTNINRNGTTLDLSFDVDDNVISIADATGTTTDYSFDALGGRSQASSGATVRRYLVAPAMGAGHQSNHAVLDDTGLLVASYVYAGEHPLMRIDASGAITYYLQDPQGSTIALANAAGESTANFTYDSFGNERSATGTNTALPTGTIGDYRFQGMWLDDSGLYFVRARSYDSQTGRFLSRDPWRGEANRPETLMPYTFVEANPWIGEDPSGQFTSIAGTSVSISIVGIMASMATVAKVGIVGVVATVVAWSVDCYAKYLEDTAFCGERFSIDHNYDICMKNAWTNLVRCENGLPRKPLFPMN